ncbi:hypothetical protein HDU91_000984, partial [Kappamyces sp. JEL0680]
MLPRLPSPDDGAAKSTPYQVLAPPEIDIHKELAAELADTTQSLEVLKRTNANLTESLYDKVAVISDLKFQQEFINRNGRALDETDRMLLTEKKLRLDTERELEKTELLFAQSRQEFSHYKEYASATNGSTVKDNAQRLRDAEGRIVELEQTKRDLEQVICNKDFEIDGLSVELIKQQRRNETLETDNAYAAATDPRNLQMKADLLTETSEALAQENGLLQKRIRELIDANKEVTSNYQIVKKNFDIKKHDADELALEVEEAKNACQLALKQKKTIKDELLAASKLKAEMEESVKSLTIDSINQKATIEEL